MTHGQRKTLIVLAIWLGLEGVLSVGLIVWEFYSISLGDHATITETIKVLYAFQQWPFLLVGLLITGILGWLGGHFFAAPAEEYERIRRGEQ